MAWAIGASQPGNWAIGASQPDVAAAGGAPQVIIVTKEKETNNRPVRVAIAAAFMTGECTRRDFHKKAIVSGIIGI